MFIPPTENEIRACVKNYDDDIDSIVIQKNDSYDDSNLKYSNVINSENAKFQKNKNDTKPFNHYKHESGTATDKMAISGCKKNENQTLFGNSIENGEIKVSIEENGNSSKFKFWNFRSIFQTKKVSFPIQKDKSQSIESKILHQLCQYGFILCFLNFLEYHFTLFFVLLIFYFLSLYAFIDTQVYDYSYIYLLFAMILIHYLTCFLSSLLYFV